VANSNPSDRYRELTRHYAVSPPSSARFSLGLFPASHSHRVCDSPWAASAESLGGFLGRGQAERQENRTDLNLLAGGKPDGSCPHPFAIQKSSVLAAEVLDRGIPARNENPRMLAGDRGVVDPDGG